VWVRVATGLPEILVLTRLLLRHLEELGKTAFEVAWGITPLVWVSCPLMFRCYNRQPYLRMVYKMVGDGFRLTEGSVGETWR
jgi:hypothetical protein